MTVWTTLGWVGNGCFLARSLVQWRAVEKTRSSHAPASFWLLSMAGSALAGAYAAHRGCAVLFAGFVANGVIYLRNLQIQVPAASRRTLSPRLCVLLAAMGTGILLAAGWSDLQRSVAATTSAWVAVAMLGQGTWSSRFVLQWWHSERAGVSHFPAAFWTLSLVGNLLLLACAVHLGDAVLTAGFLPGPVMQIRNLALARRPLVAVEPAPSHPLMQHLAAE
jgi:lipid-A-disaccharide synthase-like uncharacterized protein